MTRSIRVLVADDESRLRELLVRELGRKGHEVEGVSDGEAALTRLRDAAYDIVILDMKMPRKEGIEVLRELGRGKELVARAIHERSPRAQRPFVPIHCGALPREVLESELFGHEKGAFTGAIAAKPGLIDLADGGTLLLDEIGEMEPDSQVKLLRALETGMFFRVGSTRSRTVDVRIVASTNRDLAEAMKSGEVRQDLYYRINTITVTLPPLRERPEDIALLAQHFVEANAAYGAKRLSAAALAALEAYP